LEVVGALGSSGIQSGVDESKRRLASVLADAVQQGDNSSPNRGRAAGSVDLFKRSLDGNEVAVSQSRDVREGTVGRVLIGRG